jgi:DNA-binding transcriptional regulator GbsR (MarR family)
MGTRWGVNRTVAQIHALLFATPEPMTADEIATTLSVARSNVSISLRELQAWGLVKLVHVIGDRKDHFEAIQDVWQMLHVILDERKQREIDPTLTILRECVVEAAADDATGEHARQKIAEMLEFFEVMTTWYDQVRRMPRPVLIKFVRLGDKLIKLVG